MMVLFYYYYYYYYYFVYIYIYIHLQRFKTRHGFQAFAVMSYEVILCFYCIIQFGPWNSKPGQNLLIICLLLSVSLDFVSRHLYIFDRD